jgi:hypothetical protein
MPGESGYLVATRDSSDQRWLSYLFETHAESTLRDWGRRLHLFRFVRASGGHANDGDQLLVSYRWASASELSDFFVRLDLPLVRHDRMPPQATTGITYSFNEITTFPSLIPGTQWIEQPKFRKIAGQPVFIWCSEDRINLSIAGGYEVSEEDVQSAQCVEVALRDVCLPRVDPPVDRKHCVCPKYHPHLFETD